MWKIKALLGHSNPKKLSLWSHMSICCADISGNFKLSLRTYEVFFVPPWQHQWRHLSSKLFNDQRTSKIGQTWRLSIMPKYSMFCIPRLTLQLGRPVRSTVMEFIVLSQAHYMTAFLHPILTLSTRPLVSPCKQLLDFHKIIKRQRLFQESSNQY